MKIAVVNGTSRRVAGTEAYLELVLDAFVACGHEVLFCSETDTPSERPFLRIPAGVSSWRLEEAGAEEFWRRFTAVTPDLIYAHGRLSDSFETRLIATAPSVYFAHNYYGLCISGLKTHQAPIVEPCGKRFGAACLLHYLPRRCGGLNPVTMFQLYAQERQRMETLKQYSAIVTHSEQMRQEFICQGMEPDRTFSIPFAAFDHAPVKPVQSDSATLRLLFVGRMEKLKGGHILLEAVPEIARALNRPLHVTFAGDGPRLEEWKAQATWITSGNSAIVVSFAGWLDRSGLDRLWPSTDILAVPSLWPEPFGLVGPEAGLHGVPAVAFDTGGVSEWLTPGVNGFLAPADPPSPSGLAAAVVRCVDRAILPRLRQGAFKLAQRFSVARHVTALNAVFDQVADKRRPVAVSN